MSQSIELNGKRYDAKSGKIMSAHQTVSDGTREFVKPITKQSGVSLDGFSRRKTPAAHAVHKKTEKSRTLMRQAVKKPAETKSKQNAPAIARRRPAHHPEVDPRKVTRASAVKKSTLISKFGLSRKPINPITSILPVRPEPDAPPAQLMSEHHKLNLNEKQSSHHKNFHHALNNADSHKQAKAKKSTRRQRLSRRLSVSTRTVNLAAASLAAVLLIGFIAYQNVPNLSMRVAATRAGVDGNLPTYQPSGFGLSGPISYQPGQITINYKSHSDERQFKVSQRSSEWNSEALLENYVTSDDKTYQTFQDSGKTIYIYNDNNATWVDGGVWYQIEGNSALSNDQLLRMAASM